MRFTESQKLVRAWGLVAISAMATVLLAAAADPDAAWARIKALPIEQRARLLENLHRFDLTRSADQQSQLRSIDSQIAALDPMERNRYFDVLERYHNWLDHLPAKSQDEIQNTALSERMVVVRKLITIHKPPREDNTPEVLRLADIGDLSPFEMAVAYKTWVAASAAQRLAVEQLPLPRRRSELRKLTRDLGISREIKAKNYKDEQWLSNIQARWKDHNNLLYEGLVVSQKELAEKKPLANSAEVFLAAKEDRRLEILKRQAINLYFWDADRRRKAVDADNLVLFMAGLPPWMPSAYDQFAPDEARRRLSVVYRLVFPTSEITKAVGASSKGSVGPGTATKASPRAEPARSQPAAAPKTERDAPF